MNTGNLYAIIGMDPKQGVVATSGEDLLHRLFVPSDFVGERVELMNEVTDRISQAKRAFRAEYKFSSIDELSSLYQNQLETVYSDGMMNIGEIMASFDLRNKYNRWLDEGRMEYGGDMDYFSTYFRELESLFRLIEQEGDQRKQERTRITIRKDKDMQDQLLALDNRPLPQPLADLHSRILSYNVDNFRRISLGYGIAQGMSALV